MARPDFHDQVGQGRLFAVDTEGDIVVFALARASEDGVPPPKQMFMHGGQYFLIHEGDLHFTLLDPKAKAENWAAHPRQGPGWDKDLFLTPHPTPPKESVD
jgi:hypothetical protein